jgi:phosphatidylserine decarboxylase
MLTPQIPVAKEGWPFIGFAAFCTLVFAFLGYSSAAVIMLLATTFILAFFRDPERFVPNQQETLVSPADGKVIIVEQVDDKQFTGQQALKVSIFMNVFNVHVNRLPCSGKVLEVIYRPGKFHSADSTLGGLENEYCATIVETPATSKIAVVQIAGLIARRIICWLEPGDQGVKGRRFGLIRFGSRVDLYLPVETVLTVKVGDKVRAGETVIGRLTAPFPSS